MALGFVIYLRQRESSTSLFNYYTKSWCRNEPVKRSCRTWKNRGHSLYDRIISVKGIRDEVKNLKISPPGKTFFPAHRFSERLFKESGFDSDKGNARKQGRESRRYGVRWTKINTVACESHHRIFRGVCADKLDDDEMRLTMGKGSRNFRKHVAE